MNYKNLNITNHGVVRGERDGGKFGANLSLLIIQTAWSHGCDFSDIIELSNEDWSFVRDADEEDTNSCFAKALNFINKKLK